MRTSVDTGYHRVTDRLGYQDAYSGRSLACRDFATTGLSRFACLQLRPSQPQRAVSALTKGALLPYDGAVPYIRRMVPPPNSAGRPVVLVVDDEPVALAVLQRTLEPHYHVLTASDGLEALKVMETSGEDIRVVVTDVRMPRLSGPALAAHLARLKQSPAILFVSGFTDPDVPGEVLAKPFSPEALLGAVARLLESREPSARL